MLVLLALVLFAVFAILGFAYHLLWLGLILAVLIGVVDLVTRNAHDAGPADGAHTTGKDALAGPSLRGEGLGEPDR